MDSFFAGSQIHEHPVRALIRYEGHGTEWIVFGFDDGAGHRF